MSKFENKPGYGTAFKNDKFEVGGRFPYADGKVKDPSGKEWDVSLWIPKSDKVKGFTIQLKEPWVGPGEQPSQVAQPEQAPQVEADELPF